MSGRISLLEYEEALDQYMGWCTACQALTRENTEPDAEGYDCPECGQDTVMGVEEALVTEELEVSED